MAFDCVIFDLDGTLTDTPTAIARTIVAVVASTGHPAPSLEAALATVGRPLDETFRYLLPESAWGIIPECVASYRAIYDRSVVPSTQLFPGVADTLAACCASGLRLAVATTKLTRIAETALLHCGILHYFDAILGGDRAARPKPDPELALVALSELGCLPEQALVVGDTTYDVGMGRAARTKTCAVTYGVHSRAQLEEAGTDYIIDRFSDLTLILGIPTPDRNGRERVPGL